MIYVMEGPDNVGKGTQIINLKKYLELKGNLVHVLHYSNIKGDNIETRSKIYYKQMFDICENAKNYDIILDRAHLGETVYSPIYRGYSGDYVFNQEKECQCLSNMKLFVFIDDPENLIKREDGFSFSTELEIKIKEIEGFKRAFQMSYIPHKVLIHIKNYDEKDVWNIIQKKLEEVKYAEQPTLF